MTPQPSTADLRRDELLVHIERRWPRPEQMSFALTPEDWDKLATYIDAKLDPRWLSA